MLEIECPVCGAEFDAVEWTPGEYPKCGKRYSGYPK